MPMSLPTISPADVTTISQTLEKKKKGNRQTVATNYCMKMEEEGGEELGILHADVLRGINSGDLYPINYMEQTHIWECSELVPKQKHYLKIRHKLSG